MVQKILDGLSTKEKKKIQKFVFNEKAKPSGTSIEVKQWRLQTLNNQVSS